MTKSVFIAILFAFSLSINNIYAQKKTYQLSSHILDITVGQPAKNVEISLYKQGKNDNWVLKDKKLTDNNGRVNSFLEQNNNSENRGVFKLKFETKPYFAKQNKDTFYPFVEVVFEINNDNHYHVPITLTPYGYSTYRGN